MVDTLRLPRSKEIPKLGLRWRFNYKIKSSGKTFPSSQSLHEAGVQSGEVVRLRISGTYEDLYNKS